MPITGISDIAAGLAANPQMLKLNKASLSNQVAGGWSSLWRVTGQPAQAAIPAQSPVEYPTKDTLGAFVISNPSGSNKLYLAQATYIPGTSGLGTEIHDRLGHMGNLLANATSNYTVNIDAASVVNQARIGATDYSDVQWWIEWYADTGATAVTATVTYTNGAGTTGRTTTVALAATMRAARMLPIIGINNEPIRRVDNIQLSATTGTAGNFGVTATRRLTTLTGGLATTVIDMDWQRLGLPEVPSDSCLFPIMVPAVAATGSALGTMSMIQR